MMAGNHPNDIELLEYVEGDLDERAAATVREHLAACETCAGEVARLQQASAALQATPLLELPADRQQQILASLPAQEREHHRMRGLFTRRRVLAVLAPAAVAAAIVVAVVSLDGTGADEEAAAPPPSVLQAEAAPAEPAPAGPPASAAAEAAPPSAEDSAGGAEEAAPAPTTTEAPTTARAQLSVGGTPDEVATRLEQAGLVARVVGETVEVEGATEAEVEKLLEDLGPGGVSVRVVERQG